MSDSQSISVPAATVDSGAPSTQVEFVHRSLLSCYMELGKVRLSGMVVVTTALGFIVASKTSTIPPSLDVVRLAWTCLGTFLAAIGASAFNQAIEAQRDSRMNRTRHRPIPGGHLSRMHALYFGLLCCIAGVAILCPTSNGLTAILATANVLIYVLLYTPLKPISASNTLVGGVVGAIPPMMGWSAASGSLALGAWILGGILFVWQIPHFLALAWMYRDDYVRGGYKMISTIEPTGRLTGMLAVVYSFALIPLAMSLGYFGYSGWPFVMVGCIMGFGIVALAGRFAITRSRADARRLFLATITYLPLLSVTLILDARSFYDRFDHARAGYVQPSDQKFTDPSQAQ